MEGVSFYSVLNIPEYSDISIVKKAFRQLALKYHPDRNPDPQSAEIFKTLVTAYETLGNAELKIVYDKRLKLGLEFEMFGKPEPENERENRKRWYAKMRREQDAIREVENITEYENSLKFFPFLWRIRIIALILFTGILIILSGWYTFESKIASGGLIFFIFSLLFWNELYKHYWHKSLTEGENSLKHSYDRLSYYTFLKVFLGGLILLLGLVKIKKEWHLYYFGNIINAELVNEGKSKNSESDYYVTYMYDQQIYRRKVYFLPEKYKNLEQIKIKISSQEPEIWEYVKE